MFVVPEMDPEVRNITVTLPEEQSKIGGSCIREKTLDELILQGENYKSLSDGAFETQSAIEATQEFPLSIKVESLSVSGKLRLSLSNALTFLDDIE